MEALISIGFSNLKELFRKLKIFLRGSEENGRESERESYLCTSSGKFSRIDIINQLKRIKQATTSSSGRHSEQLLEAIDELFVVQSPI